MSMPFWKARVASARQLWHAAVGPLRDRLQGVRVPERWRVVYGILRARYWRVSFISPHQAAFAVAVAVALTVLTEWSGISGVLDFQLAARAQYVARAALGFAPHLAPNIKVFVYDDPMVARVKAADLSLADWATVLEALARRKPRVIVIDKLFDLPLGRDTAASFVQRIRAAGARVAVGAFVSQAPIFGRDELQLSDWASASPTASADSSIPIAGGYPYGPASELQPAFHGIGQIVYRNDGLITPLMRLDDIRTLPHASLFAAEEFSFDDGVLKVNQRPLPLLTNGGFLVDVVDPGELMKRSLGFRTLYNRARSGNPISVVNEGDVVVLLPAMFTGNADRVVTSLGTIPGGFLITSAVNDMVVGPKKWLRAIEARLPLALGAISLGTAVSLLLWGTPLTVALVVGPLLVSSLGLLAFTFFGIVLPWLVPALSFLVAGGGVLGFRLRGAEMEHDRMEREFATTQLVQTTIFPSGPIRNEFLAVGGFYKPASECSGDWWGYWPSGVGQGFLVVGDAIGHGTPAAFVTGLAYAASMTIAALMNDTVVQTMSPAAILRRMNSLMHQATRGEFTMTMFLIYLDAQKGEMTFSNAGHLFPYLLPAKADDDRSRSKGRAVTKHPEQPTPITLRAVGNPLGDLPDTHYADVTMPLRLGDRLLLFTDGLIECAGENGRVWDRRQLSNKFASLHALDACALKEALVGMALKHFGAATLDDDFTVVVAEVLGLGATCRKDEAA